MAAVRVVLPWSMLLIGPTLTWTFFTTNNSLGCNEQPFGSVAPSPNRFSDLFSTPSETRASGTTGIAVRTPGRKGRFINARSPRQLNATGFFVHQDSVLTG